ncbi:MAG: pyridoxamine 5'-phosphate oxidase family protein [Candidatus Ancaeobacter aquaticus]|nr:pyridoxamine 5'-phosphate oxidase family protein [Candidatus Ancaeobacter aquaticus]
MDIINLQDYFVKKEFVFLATSDLKGTPNVAPKFFLKQEDKTIYLIDYAFGKTLDNLRENPLASIAGMDIKSLTGYKMVGRIVIMEKGKLYETLVQAVREKELRLSVQRIAEGVRTQKKHAHFKLGLSGKVIIYKFTLKRLTVIQPGGEATQKKL